MSKLIHFSQYFRKCVKFDILFCNNLLYIFWKIYQNLSNLSKLTHFLQSFEKCVQIDPLLTIFQKMCQIWYTFCGNLLYILENITKIVKFVQVDPLFVISFRKCVKLFYHFVNWKMRQNGKSVSKLIHLILYLENVPEVVFMHVISWKMCPRNITFCDILTNRSSLIHYLWYRYHGCLLPMGRVITLKSTKEPKP